MLIQKTVKIQNYLKEFDKELLAKYFSACKFIYNKFLKIRQKEYTENKKSLNYYANSALVSQIEKDPSPRWLKEKEINVVKNILRQGLNILSSGQGTGSDVKQKPEEAPGLLGSMSPENTRSLIGC